MRKLEGALDRAESLRFARLAQDHATAAAERLLARFMAQRHEVAALAPDADLDAIATRCDVALADLVRCIPLLG